MRPAIAETLESPAATAAAGRDLARRVCAAGLDELIVFLSGDLGAGKTTFVRGFLAGLGHDGRVPSPTYTLIEPYEIDSRRVYHVDLYRLMDPREADELGLAELPGPGVLMLVEWPERGGNRLHSPDLSIRLEVAANGRNMVIQAGSAVGKRLLAHKNV